MIDLNAVPGDPGALAESGDGAPVAIPATLHSHCCISLAIEGTLELFAQPALVLHFGPIAVCDIPCRKVIGKRLRGCPAG